MTTETPMQQAFNDGRHICEFYKAVRAQKRKNYHKPRTHTAKPGEVTLKQWKQDESLRLKTTVSNIEARLSRGQYPKLRIRRVNKRVIFVKP